MESSGKGITGELLVDYGEYYETNVLLFNGEVQTNIGIVWEEGHQEPWIIAMDCEPNREEVLAYGGRQANRADVFGFQNPRWSFG